MLKVRWITELQKTHLWKEKLYSPSAWWLCRRRLLCGRRSQTQNTDGHKRAERIMKTWQLEWDTDDSNLFIYPIQIYLVVKGSIGPFFDRSLFLLISDLNNHTGVDVFSHQLSGLGDVNGNLWDGQKWNYSQLSHPFFCIFIVILCIFTYYSFVHHKYVPLCLFLSLCIKMVSCVVFNELFSLIIYIFFSCDEYCYYSMFPWESLEIILTFEVLYTLLYSP